MQETLKRRLYHLVKSGCIMIGIEHFLVMFPSAMLIARLSNTKYGTIVELPTILLFCGVGTLVFVLMTRRRIPFFLGPCFAFIGFLSYHVGLISSVKTFEEIRATVYYGYLISGIFLLLLSLLYRFNWFKKLLKALLPDTVMGPAISLLGLTLAGTGVNDSGFYSDDNLAKYLAVITILSIIILSLLKHHFLQNASVLLGVFAGCLFATIWKVAQWPILFSGSDSIIKMPHIYFNLLMTPPVNLLRLGITVLPPTLIAFVEGIGRLTVYDGMLKRDNRPHFETSADIMLKQSASNIFTSIAGITPNTIYAENMAIMNLHGVELATQRKGMDDPDEFVRNCHSTYSIYPYIIASILCITVAFIGQLQDILIAIPKSVFGGMELFVFGLITAPGIQILVEQQVNYKKISNQIITSSVLLAGVSGLSFQKDSLVLEGMSLGLVVGAAVNIITMLLRNMGLLNERIMVSDIITQFFELYQGNMRLCYSSSDGSTFERTQSYMEWKEYIDNKTSMQSINLAEDIKVADVDKEKTITIKQDSGKLHLYIDLNDEYRKKISNDYETEVSPSASNSTCITITDKITQKTIKQLLRNIK